MLSPNTPMCPHFIPAAQYCHDCEQTDDTDSSPARYSHADHSLPEHDR